MIEFIFVINYINEDMPFYKKKNDNDNLEISKNITLRKIFCLSQYYSLLNEQLFPLIF